MSVRDAGRLATLVALSGVSVRTLAARLGHKSHSWVWRLLQGKVRTVRPAVAARVAAILGVGMDELFVPVPSRIPDRDGQATRP